MGNRSQNKLQKSGNHTINGVCHICLKESKLSFEHIPPRSCFNDGKAKIGQKISQRGIGDYTLCESCNNKTGAWYVKDYELFVKSVVDFINVNYRLFNENDFIDRYCVHVEQINPLLCAKEMLAMMCSILSLDEVDNLGISNFLLNKYSHLNGRPRFQLLVGTILDEENGFFIKDPILLGMNNRCYGICVCPLRILLVVGDEINISGYSDFTNYLMMDIKEPTICDFCVGFKKDDVFDYFFKHYWHA